MPSALVTGITGQDGWYLAELLQAAGEQVFGLVVPGDPHPLPPGVTAVEGDLRDGGSITRALERSAADVVYNLAALSSVAASWTDPVPVAEVTGVGVARLLAAVRGSGVRVVHASSAEIFGDAPAPQSEATPVAPTNPYGAAKAFAQHLVQAFRAQGVRASTAILFPHESPRRPAQFVSRKITRTVAAIAAGSDEQLVLGNLDARRDWGFAGDYARALQLIAAHEEPDDFVIATGESHSIRDFAAAAFEHAGVVDWERRVERSDEFVRPADAGELRGDATRARELLGWAPSVDFAGLVAMMVDADRG